MCGVKGVYAEVKRVRVQCGKSRVAKYKRFVEDEMEQSGEEVRRRATK